MYKFARLDEQGSSLIKDIALEIDCIAKCTQAVYVSVFQFLNAQILKHKQDLLNKTTVTDRFAIYQLYEDELAITKNIIQHFFLPEDITDLHIKLQTLPKNLISQAKKLHETLKLIDCTEYTQQNNLIQGWLDENINL
jgi:hypothetical protein